jgi:regulator of sigma E protease
VDLLVTIVAFIAIFGLLIFVHEFGHFIVAKRNGIKVEEFAFGLPLLPAIFRTKRGETEYAIYPVPLGGFVRMLGEDGHSRSKRSFAAKPRTVRAKVLFAGVAMNILLALVLLTIGFLFKMSPIALCASDYPATTFTNDVTLVAVSDSGPAKAAGLEAGDVVKTIDGQTVSCFTQVPQRLKAKAGQPVSIGIIRGGDAQEIAVTPRGPGEPGSGTIGVAPQDHYTHLDYPWYIAPYLAVIESGAVVAQNLGAIGQVFTQIFTQGSVPEGVSGPVGIAKLTGQVVDLGALMVLRFIAIISLSLAVFNLLPIPALDGGRLLFVGIEALRGGKPVTPKIENAIHAAGFTLLILLILFITYFDIVR